jgi:hypothetical protein
MAGNFRGFRHADNFIGGETLPVEARVTGTGFYNTIKELGGVRRIYKWAEAKWFDVYEKGTQVAYGFANALRQMHTGLLNLYLMWVFLGLLVLLIVLMGR